MKKTLSLVLALALLMTMAFAAVPASADELTELHTYETTARELEKWNIQLSQAAQDLNVLNNLIDGLLTNDNHGNLKPNAAKEYSTSDGGQTWTFKLNEGMTWFDKDGNYKADVVANDWVVGLEWVLNYAKNDSYNTSMPMEMITGAAAYYEYTKQVAEEQGTEAAQALGTEKFLEMVGIETPDEYTVVYHLIDKLPYFPSVATYNCLYPLSAKCVEELGVEGYRSVTWENLWYSGPYTVTSYIHQNEKILTASPNYWNKDAKRFDNVVIKMVESADVAYNLFETGELDHVDLPQAPLATISGNENHEFYKNLVEKRPTKYSYQMHFVYDKKNEDGTSDVNWNTAIANKAFRQSMYYGLELTSYLARTNAVYPQHCQNYCYTGNGVAFTTTGTDYTQLVRDAIGLQYDAETFNRYDADKAAAYKAQAIEELTAKGVTFPVVIDYYIKGDNQTAKDSADVLKQIFSDCLGDDYIVLNIKTYVSDLTNEVRKPQLCALYINGWGADFADPINFLGQETYGEDGAYYSNNYSMINNATDEDLIAAYTEFTNLTNKAKAITDDYDARLAAFAEAEAYFLDQAFTIPCNYEVSWELTLVNDYSKVFSAYGIQAYRYVDWDTQNDLYTAAQYDELKTAYEAEG